MDVTDMCCSYKSVKYVKVKNHKLSAVYWTTMLLVAIYIVAYTIVGQKGYQETSGVSGSTSIKVKGTGSIGDVNGPISELLPLDAMDLVQPSIEQNSLFVVTARVITPNQTRSMHCEGNRDVPECTVNDTSACTESLHDPFSQGIYTGNCGANGRCEMYTWCPMEDDSSPDTINGVGDFTAFVKVDISFDTFGVSRHNYYHKFGTGPTHGYNLFSVDDMLYEATNGAVTSASDVANEGAIILATSTWNCNLDRSEDRCDPEWNFNRIDGQDPDASFSSGFNYRTVTYDTTEGSRSLAKLYGIRFVFVIEGTAGKFSFVATSVTFGAGLAYLSIAAIFADVIMLRFLGKTSKDIKEKKEDLVDDGTVDELMEDLAEAVNKPRKGSLWCSKVRKSASAGSAEEFGNETDASANSIELVTDGPMTEVAGSTVQCARN